MEHITPDLAPPLDLLLLGIGCIFQFIPFPELLLIQPALKHGHRFFAVTKLGTLGLANHHEPCGQVGKHDLGLHFVYILSAGSPASRGFHFHFTVLDFNIDGIIDERVYKY